MTAATTVFQQTVFTSLPAQAPSRFAMLKTTLDVMAKTLLMAQAVSCVGRPTERQMTTLRKIAASL